MNARMLKELAVRAGSNHLPIGLTRQEYLALAFACLDQAGVQFSTMWPVSAYGTFSFSSDFQEFLETFYEKVTVPCP